MKINWKLRIKNVWPWIGIITLILSAMGCDPEMFTSWEIVWDEFLALVSNPFRLGTVAISVISILVDPTTKGLGDSQRAMTYKTLEDSKETK